MYPTSVRISNLINMLIAVESFSVELRSQTHSAATKDVNFVKESSVARDVRFLKNLEVVLVIEELRVISFDRFGMKMPSSVAFDDQVRAHLNFLRHFLMKQVLLIEEFDMPPICNLTLRHAKVANEERSSYFPLAGSTKSRFEPNDFHQHRNGAIAPNKLEKPANASNFDLTDVVKIRGEDSPSRHLKQKRLNKQKRKEALRMLKEQESIDGFLSCTESEASIIDKITSYS